MSETDYRRLKVLTTFLFSCLTLQSKFNKRNHLTESKMSVWRVGQNSFCSTNDSLRKSPETLGIRYENICPSYESGGSNRL